MKVTGITIGVIELILFYFLAKFLRNENNDLNKINEFSYYWMMMTCLTAIWEIAFIINYKKIIKISDRFMRNKTTVWSSKFNLKYIIPWNLSKIFYADYGANADKEYISTVDIWSRTIEGSHFLFCGFFSLLALVFSGDKNLYNFFTAIGMSSQLMNSVLYMTEYYIQTQNVNSINYDSPKFPCGFMMMKRPFMYVNILWTLFPSIVLLNTLTTMWVTTLSTTTHFSAGPPQLYNE